MQPYVLKLFGNSAALNSSSGHTQTTVSRHVRLTGPGSHVRCRPCWHVGLQASCYPTLMMQSYGGALGECSLCT